jgi:hypothetical protein
MSIISTDKKVSNPALSPLPHPLFYLIPAQQWTRTADRSARAFSMNEMA